MKSSLLEDSSMAFAALSANSASLAAWICLMIGEPFSENPIQTRNLCSDIAFPFRKATFHYDYTIIKERTAQMTVI